MTPNYKTLTLPLMPLWCVGLAVFLWRICCGYNRQILSHLNLFTSLWESYQSDQWWFCCPVKQKDCEPLFRKRLLSEQFAQMLVFWFDDFVSDMLLSLLIVAAVHSCFRHMCCSAGTIWTCEIFQYWTFSSSAAIQWQVEHKQKIQNRNAWISRFSFTKTK